MSHTLPLDAAAPPRTKPAHRQPSRRWQLPPALWAWPVPLAGLALWWLAAEAGWIAPQVLPSPATVGHTLWDMLQSGELWGHLQISLWRVLTGFALGSALGLLLGVGMGLSSTVKDLLYPSFKAVSQVPVLGWLPLLMLLVGIDEALKVIVVAKAALVPVTLNTYKGLQNVPTRYIEVARVLGFSHWQLLRRVVAPAALAPLWGGVRYGLTQAWLALVVVELLASSEGLGYLIVYGRQLFQLDVVMAAVVVVAAVGYALDRMLATVEERLLGWRQVGL
jgi:sulfonate transport system permease protein